MNTLVFLPCQHVLYLTHHRPGSVNLVVNIVAVMIVTGIITMVLLLQLLWILRSRMWLLLPSQL